MSSVKALPIGHVTGPMYVVMDRSPHDVSGGAPYKRPPHQGGQGALGGSPPLTGTRGYPYPQDPGSRPPTTSYASPSPHLLHPGNAIYANSAPNHIYREPHFQVDTRPPVDGHHLDRYTDTHVQHVRRRLSLRPTPEYNVALERERYMEAIRYQYEREVAMGVPYQLSGRALKPPVVSVHTPSEMDVVQPIKRPRLAQEPKAPVHQPLLIDTRNVVVKKEPAYTPQVEAISPTLPSEEGRCESPIRPLKETIFNSINRIDKEINQIESQVTKLQKKMVDLEAEDSKPSEAKEAAADICPIESKQMSIAQIIYSENRSKAQESYRILEKLGPKIDMPMYNQPSDTAVYHENKRRYQCFKSRLIKCFKKRHREREFRANYLTKTYSKLMQEWLKKIEKKESNAAKKAKDAKLREFFEKQFPELKKQREDKERISRVSQRIRSESEWEEIIDGLQEQENEEKKMRSYAVIPPILLDQRHRGFCWDNRNGLVEDLSQEYKERQMLNVWTAQEKEIFREKYLLHPKNFALIASFLERKSVSDCVQYYYLSKKGENYKQLLRRHNVRKRRALVKPPQAQQQPVVQGTGVTTRQQEDAKASSLASNSNALQAGAEVMLPLPSSTDHATSLATMVSSGSLTTVNSAADPSCSASTTFIADLIPSRAETSDFKSELKVPIPNNIRKKKKDAAQMEHKDDMPSDSDTASDHPNENNVAQPCVICKNVVENFSQSRLLNKSNCTMFGIKENELQPEMRICGSCRFKSVRRRCPIPTCKTPKRKVKRLRPLPPKFIELPKEAKDAISTELQIPADVGKCCSACFNRIVRKLENNSPTENESTENSRWNDEEIEAVKKGISQHGSNWEAVATLVGSKTKEQCRNFFFNYKRKLGLDDILQEYKKLKGDDGLQDGKPPPSVTDEEESGETTSSCDEDDHADRCSSDTASAPSPVDKILIDDKNESQRAQQSLSGIAVNATVNLEEVRNRNLSLIDASPKCPPDYDSSATVSADEGQDAKEGRDPSPRVVHPSNHSVLKMPLGGDRKAFQCPLPLSKDIEGRSSDTSIPLVKTLLQDPKIGATPSDGSAFVQAVKTGKDEPTCVRDLIYQAIEMSLQWPAKSGRNNSPIPASLVLGKDVPDIAIVDPKKELDGPMIPPTAHGGSRHPSRPSSHHMEAPPDCEVQDLSRKIKSRDVSPVKDLIKRERVVTPVRPASGSSSSTTHAHYYGTPPPAHCNQFRSTQPPPALSPHYVAEPHHEPYYSRTAEPRNKAYLASERPHSQPPHLVAQSSGTPLVSSHQKPIPVKASVPPPPPLVASKPSQISPKMPFKERLPPTGSITQGTPVNQQSLPIPPTNLGAARYEGFLRQLPPPQSKDGGGSITLGTPVQHDSVKRISASRPETFAQENLIRQAVPAMYDPSVIEYYRQVTPNGQQFPFPPGYSPFQSTVTPQRPPYANESQLSSKQIMIDFNTSKQMPRKWSEKEMKVSPRGSDSSPAPVPQDMHPMYPPVNYQGSGSAHYNHTPPGYSADSRYVHHRSPSSQIDRTRSPSGVESPLSAGYSTHPGKRSPSLALSSGRQNVIHRSITWGTGKPSVIQAPQSASPRIPDMRTETVSPASVRKSTPSPRHPQPILYPSMPPSGHDAFTTLVNAAVAQPSLVVPKDGKGSPSINRQEVKSPRDRPVVEGLEKTLIDMHQRPRSYTDSGSSLSSHDRIRASDLSPADQQTQINDTRYQHGHYDFSRDQRLSEKQMLAGDQPTTLRLGNMREPFSREQFERQMRQTNVSTARDRAYIKKEEERNRTSNPESQPQNYSSPQQSDLDNEASKIFSQSFQKDIPRSNSSPRGFTAANLIDAIITRQINQNVDASAANRSSGIDLFGHHMHSGYEESKGSQKSSNGKTSSRTEIVTIDDEPENEKPNSWPDRSSSHGRSPPATTNAPASYGNEKVYTLSEHIAAIISKDYNSPADVTQSQPHFTSSQSAAHTVVSQSSRSSPYVGGSHNSPSGKPLEGIASVLPSEAVLVNPNVHGIPDHSAQNCPGNGCIYHTHSWKLRRALQQDREHRSPVSVETVHKRPSSNHSSDSVPQEERQIIRVAQNSPSAPASTRASPTGPYGVEPISPPSQNESSDSRTSSGALSQPPPAWASNPSITGLLTARHIYPPDYAEGIPPPSIATHYGAPTTTASGPAGGLNRPPHQQQMGLSPLDYVKSRIVEVMRTATDAEPETESRRPQSAAGQTEERDHPLPHAYRYQHSSEKDVSSERPLSTGNGPPILQGQRYSPAVTRYSPVPPRPSSAAERVPSRNSTPGDLSRPHKRGPEGHIISDWREGQTTSRASSRSVSPNSIDHNESVSRKKTRAEGTFIPESGLDRAPVLLPQNSISIHRSGSISEAPRLSSSNSSSQIIDHSNASKSILSPRTELYHPQPSESENYKFRVSENRPEGQWSHLTGRTSTEPVNSGSASSTTEPVSPANRTSDMGTRQSPLTGGQEPSRNSPSIPQGQRSASSTPVGASIPSSSGLYTPFGPPNGGVSSSTGAMFSSAASLPPPPNPHVAYSSFSGMGSTYAYPYSALSVRTLAASTTHNSTPISNSSSVTSSHLASSTPARNTTSPLHRNNQPPPLLSSQYEPLSDED